MSLQFDAIHCEMSSITPLHVVNLGEPLPLQVLQHQHQAICLVTLFVVL